MYSSITNKATGKNSNVAKWYGSNPGTNITVTYFSWFSLSIYHQDPDSDDWILLPKWPWHLGPSDHQSTLQFVQNPNDSVLLPLLNILYLAEINGTQHTPKRCNNKNSSSWKPLGMAQLWLLPAPEAPLQCHTYHTAHCLWHSIWNPTLGSWLSLKFIVSSVPLLSQN